MARIKRIDHIAIVVDEMDNTLAFWRDALGMEIHGVRDEPAELAQIAFLAGVEGRRRGGGQKRAGRAAGSGGRTVP